MKLTELDPRWLVRDGQRVGFVFKCPTKPQWFQSCMLAPTPTKEQWSLFNEALVDLAPSAEEREWQYTRVQGCNSAQAWRIVGGADFHDLSVTPSIDGSAGALWHGFITNGEAV